jgi:ATP-grasp domain, R2K clade family 3
VRFLFPSDYFNSRQVDLAYAEEWDCLRTVGLETSVISLEDLDLDSAKIYPQPAPQERSIYRGWMLTPDRYSRLVDTVQASGARMWIDREEYLRTHYLPNWYPLISDLTPETYVVDREANLEAVLNNLGWDRFFIKDYVKSIGSIISQPSEIHTVVSEMEKFRGSIEGGICVRKVEDFIPETERRYFAIDRCVFAASIDIQIPEIAIECASRIDSKFLAIDVIDRSDGRQRIVEIGNGQVSGLVGWTSERFANLWIRTLT